MKRACKQVKVNLYTLNIGIVIEAVQEDDKYLGMEEHGKSIFLSNVNN